MKGKIAPMEPVCQGSHNCPVKPCIGGGPWMGVRDPDSQSVPCESAHTCGFEQHRQVEVHQRADSFNRNIGLRILGHLGLIQSVMALARENGRHLLAPCFLYRGKNSELVIDQDVMLGGVTADDIIQLLLLMDIYEDPAVEGFEQPGAMDFLRLEDHVAIRQDYGAAELLASFDYVKRVGKEPVGEGIIHQVMGDRQDVKIARVLDPVALQRAEVVSIAELDAQFFEEL